MSSDTSSSGSDSDLSDTEEIVDNVAKVFQSMKKTLSKAGVSNIVAGRSEAAGKSGLPKLVTTNKNLKPRSVYQTFKKSNKSKGSVNKNVEKCKESVETGLAKTAFVADFFIDKGHKPSFAEETDVISYDLTNINDIACGSSSDNNSDGDDIKEYGQSQEVYDLTGIGDVKIDSKYPDTEKDASGENEGDQEEMSDSEDEVVTAKLKKNKKNLSSLSSKLESGVAMQDIYVNVNPLRKNRPDQQSHKEPTKHTEPDVMKKSVISDDIERQYSIPTTHVSVRQMKKQRKLEREKTKGDKWYNMPATELTEERKYDLAVLQMRKVLDPKRFYKSNDLKTTPKYFQFGKVIEDATDFYSSRIPKKQRKSTIVEELLADAEFRQFNKRKYAEIQEAKRLGKGPYKHMKRLKKRKH